MRALKFLTYEQKNIVSYSDKTQGKSCDMEQYSAESGKSHCWTNCSNGLGA